MKSLMSKMLVLVAFTGLTASTVFAQQATTKGASQPKSKVVKVKKHTSPKSTAKSAPSASAVTPTTSAK